MKNNFNDCLNRLLKDEGGYTNDPNDSGGPTNLGITISDFRRYVKKNATAEDVKGLTIEQAKPVYRDKYWAALDCDNLPSGLDYTVFDYAVNSGLGRPRKALQKFKSLKGTELIDAINNERAGFLKALAAERPKDKKFLKGWLSRVERVRAYSKVLAGKKDNVTGPVAGGTTIGLGGMALQFWHNHEVLIIVTALVSAIAIGTVIHLIRNKGK